MLAIEVVAQGGPEVLRAVERAKPTAGPGQVVIAIKAIGVNFVDLQHRAGTPYPALAMPFIPGIEAAGEVAAIGDGVSEFKVGDRVAFAGPMPGTYAEYAVINADLIVPVPDAISANDAATILMQGLTAHYLTHDAHRTRADEWAFVHAAAGGVGRLVAAYARSMGARVIGGTTRARKLDQIRSDGADEAVDIREPGLAARVRGISGGGCAVVFDSVGGRYFEENLKCLAARGDLVVYGMSDGPIAPFDVARLSGFYDDDLNGSLRVSWTSLGDHVATPAALRARADAVFTDTLSGLLQLPKTVTFPLAEAAQAHARMASHAGEKVLLIP